MSNPVDMHGGEPERGSRPLDSRSREGSTWDRAGLSGPFGGPDELQREAQGASFTLAEEQISALADGDGAGGSEGVGADPGEHVPDRVGLHDLGRVAPEEREIGRAHV